MTTVQQSFSMFGYTPTGIDPPAAPVRRTDPSTSHAVANDRRLRIRWQSERHLLLSAFAVAAAHDSDGIIDEDAARMVYEREAVRIESVEATRRCSELRKAGYIEPTGEKRPKASGNLSACHRITRAGHDALAGIREHRRGDA